MFYKKKSIGNLNSIIIQLFFILFISNCINSNKSKHLQSSNLSSHKNLIKTINKKTRFFKKVKNIFKIKNSINHIFKVIVLHFISNTFQIVESSNDFFKNNISNESYYYKNHEQYDKNNDTKLNINISPFQNRKLLQSTTIFLNQNKINETIVELLTESSKKNIKKEVIFILRYGWIFLIALIAICTCIFGWCYLVHSAKHDVDDLSDSSTTGDEETEEEDDNEDEENTTESEAETEDGREN